MTTSRSFIRNTLAAGLALLLGGSGAMADAQADPDVAPSLSQDSVFTSLKQALKQDYDHEVVRGHFDIGSPPNVRRYYCLIDARSGRREPNGVAGESTRLANGATGLTSGSVSFYSCAKAEQQGLLVTAGYLVKGPGAAPPPQVPAPHTSPDPVAAPSPQIDVGGIKLGMSADEVRAVLKSKKLPEYRESSDTLPLPNGRFVNVIALWTPAVPVSSPDDFKADGELYEVMFTPTPGRERVMGIIHSVGYSPANAPHEVSLEDGLTKKYGGFTGSDALPQSPTWRVQKDGSIQVGDPCNGHAVLGGLGSLSAAGPARENLALKKTPEDFRLQIDGCGVAIVTEDHFTANGGALHTDRLVTRFTVTAYSPSLGLDGLNTMAQLKRAAGSGQQEPSRPTKGETAFSL